MKGAGLRSDSLPSPAWWIGGGLVYLVALSTVSYPVPDFWLFGTDSIAQCWAEWDTHHCNWQLGRHPVPWLLGWPVYQLARPVFFMLPEPWSLNLAAQFPNAVAAGANLWVGAALLRHIGLDGNWTEESNCLGEDYDPYPYRNAAVSEEMRLEGAYLER